MTTSEDEICSNCGHGYNERCERCLRSYSCGAASEPCPDCGEGVIAWRHEGDYVEWLREYRGRYGTASLDSP